MCFILEMETLLGALFMGFVSAMYAGSVDKAAMTAFANGEVATLDFWIAGLGALAVLLPLLFTPSCYVVLVTIMPVTSQNIYAFLLTPSMNNVIVMMSQLLLFTFYVIFVFVILFSIVLI